MTIQQFEEISLTLGIGGLCLYMLFVMYKLAQESNAGKFGAVIIFTSLGLGVAGYAVKSVIQMVMEV